MRCNYCLQVTSRNLTLKEIFIPQKLESEQLCSTCVQKFQLLPQIECCHGCQKAGYAAYCPDCLKWQQQFPAYDFHHESLFAYDAAMQEWFEQYKFKGNYSLRFSFAKFIAAYFKIKKNQLVIPIPISTERMKTRGFNQVAGLLEAAQVSYQPYLIRFEHSESQVTKNRKARLALKQPFKLTEKAKEVITNQEILLVDDIYTTGRTLFHAAQVILEHNPSKLNTFSIAR
ncbi:ComF family protein [Erwinia sp. CPCC 100877]|nr:ComF family protein [Erwinia sp. CPCC 100877]